MLVEKESFDRRILPIHKILKSISMSSIFNWNNKIKFIVDNRATKKELIYVISKLFNDMYEITSINIQTINKSYTIKRLRVNKIRCEKRVIVTFKTTPDLKLLLKEENE